MKKLIICFSILFSFNRGYSQDKFCIYTELSHGISFYWKNAHMYSESDIHLGVQFNTKIGSFTPYAVYRFGGYVYPFPNPKKDIITPYGWIQSEYYLTPYKFNYSAIGIGGIYRLLNSQKRISPIIQFSALTEIKLTQNGPDYYLTYDLKPRNVIGYTTDFRYFSTIFIGDLTIGADFNIVKNFNINIGAGLGARAIMAHYYDNPIPSKHWLYGVNAKLGLSYAFSIKKTNKTRI